MEQQPVSVERQFQNTVLYGMGKAVERLGPKAWEERAANVIEKTIIPRVSPEWQETLEKHKAMIAKTAGWVATGAEVAVVAGVVYGGYRGIGALRKKLFLKEVSVAPPLQANVELKTKSRRVIPLRLQKERQLDATHMALIKEEIRRSDARQVWEKMSWWKKRKIKMKRRRIVHKQPSWKKEKPIHIRIRSRIDEIRQNIRRFRLENRDTHPWQDLTGPERMLRTVLDRIATLEVLPIGIRADALGREELLLRRAHWREKQRHHQTNIARVHYIASQTPSRVASVVKSVQDRAQRRNQQELAWGAIQVSPQVNQVLREVATLVHNGKDEEVVRLLSLLRVNTLTPKNMKEHIGWANQIFQRAIAHLPPQEVKLWGQGEEGEVAILRAAANWIIRHTPGMELLT